MSPIDCACGEPAEYIVSAAHIDGIHVGVDSERWARMHEKVKR